MKFKTSVECLQGLTITKSDLTRLTQGQPLINSTLEKIIDQRLRKQFDEQIWKHSTHLEQEHHDEFFFKTKPDSDTFYFSNIWIILMIVLVLTWVFQVGGCWKGATSVSVEKTKNDSDSSDKRRDSIESKVSLPL